MSICSHFANLSASEGIPRLVLSSCRWAATLLALVHRVIVPLNPLHLFLPLSVAATSSFVSFFSAILGGGEGVTVVVGVVAAAVAGATGVNDVVGTGSPELDM